MNTAPIELTDIVAKFYEAAACPDLWSEALDLIAGAFNARGAILPGATFHQGPMPHSRGMAPVLEQFFAEGWHLRDARSIAAQKCDLARDVVTDQTLFTPDEIARSAYYEGFARSAGVPWFCAATLLLDGPADYIALSLQRGEDQGPFGAVDLARLIEVLPHLRNATALTRRLEKSRANGVLEGLDIAGTAALIVSGHGRVLATNMAFEQMAQTALYVRNGRLMARLPRQEAALAGLISAMAACDVLSARVTPGPLVLREAEGRPQCVLRAAPLRPGSGALAGHAQVLLTLTGLDAGRRCDVALLRRLYDLTPREAQIMALMGEGMDTARIAALLAVSRDTIRFHLKAILGKTGTHRQSEVVALCLRLA